MKKNKYIVVFRIGQLGDTIVSLPAIKAIKKSNQDAKLLLITDRHINNGYVSSWDILKETSIFNEVLFYDAKIFNVIQLLKIAYRLRQIKAKELYYLVPVPRSNLTVIRDKIFFKIICGAKNAHNLKFQKNIISNNKAVNEVDRLLSAVGSVNTHSNPKIDFGIPTSECIRKKIDCLMRKCGIRDLKNDLVAICPNSKMQSKRWPERNYIELGSKMLSDYYNLQLVVIGGKQDKEMGDRLCAIWGKRAFNLTGLNILESAEILRRCAVYIGNDTGAMHLAAAVGTQCIAIFSSRDLPYKWFPYGEKHIVLRKDVPCCYCLKTACSNPVCLEKITVNDVFNAFKLQMDRLSTI